MALFRPERPLQRGRSNPPGGPAAASTNSSDLAGAGDVAGASAGPGIGTISGSGAISAGGASLVASTGVLSGTGTTTGISSGAFPLSVHASGRYLVRPDGTPFLLCADTTWSLLVDIPLTGINAYFSTLVSQGFNAVMGNAIEHHFTTVKPPKERGGLLPFAQKMDGTSYTGSPNGTTGPAGTQGQFGSDNYSNINNQAPDCTFVSNSYWLAVEQILDAALANNLAILVWPGYLGFHNNDEGWLTEMVVWDAITGAGGFTGQAFADPTKSKLWNYGAWMAARWKNYPHIIWVMGGDYGSNAQTLNTAQAAAVSNLMAGLKSVAGQNSQLFSAHWDRPALSTDTSLVAGSFDINGCYADEAVAELARRGYAVTPARPTIGLEYFYEDDLFGGSAPFRKYVYWQFLGGIAGGFYGHEQLWRFDDGTPGTDYTTLLATTARLDAIRQFGFWKTLPWHRLKPSGLAGMATLVTAGGGTASPQSTDYAAAAATPEGDLLLAYVPPAHAGSITIAMTAMSATVRARWFDPTNSSFTSIGMIANTGTHAFTPPATNSAGDTDFLLVLDTPAGALIGAGDMAGTGAALAAGAGTISGTGALTGTGAALATGAGTISGTGALAGTGATLATGASTISGTGELAGTGAALSAGAGAISGTGALAGTGAALSAGAGAISGTGALAGTGAALATGAGTISGSGELIVLAASTGAIPGTGELAGTGAALSASTGAIPGTGELAGTGAALSAGASTISETGELAGTGAALSAGASAISETGELAGTGAALAASAGTISGASTLSGVSTAVGSGSGAITGSGTLSAEGAALSAGSAAISGVDALSGAGTALGTGTGSIAGSATLAGAGSSATPGSGTGSFSSAGDLAGTASALVATSGALGATGTLAGTSTSPAAATLGSTAAMSGAGAATASVSAGLAIAGNLVGAGASLSPGEGVGALSGTCAFAGTSGTVINASSSFAGSCVLSASVSVIIGPSPAVSVPPGRAPAQLVGHVATPSVEPKPSEDEHLHGTVRSRRDV